MIILEIPRAIRELVSHSAPPTKTKFPWSDIRPQDQPLPSIERPDISLNQNSNCSPKRYNELFDPEDMQLQFGEISAIDSYKEVNLGLPDPLSPPLHLGYTKETSNTFRNL